MRQHQNLSRAKGRRFEPSLYPRLLISTVAHVLKQDALLSFLFVHHTGKWTMRTGELKRKKVSLLEKDDWRTVYSNLYDMWLGFFAVSLLLVVMCVTMHAFKVQQLTKSCLGYIPVAMGYTWIFIGKLRYSHDHPGKTQTRDHEMSRAQILSPRISFESFSVLNLYMYRPNVSQSRK